MPEVQEEAHVKLTKYLLGVATGVVVTCVALYLGLLLMGEVASLVHWMIKR